MRVHVHPPAGRPTGFWSGFRHWIAGHKSIATLLATALILGGILMDAVMLSGKGVRYACGLANEDWRELLPCPAPKQVAQPAPAERVVVIERREPPQPCSEIAEPRQALACRGIAWNQDSVISAIKQGDEQTVRQFVDGGWKLHGDLFIGYLFLDPHVPLTLLEAIARPNEFTYTNPCTGSPYERKSSTANYSYYGNLANLPQKSERWAIFLKLCDRQELRARYDALILAEQRKSTEAKDGRSLQAYQRIRMALE